MFIARAFCVRTVCVFLLILGLAGCVSAGRDTAFNSTAEEGLVIVSIIERQNTGLVWFGGRATFARYDPQTLDITGSTGLRSEIITQGFTFSNSLLGAKERFRAYKLPPGDYAMLAVTAAYDRTIKTTTLVNDSPFRVRDNTPVFTVKAGEVLYIGELDIDFRPFPARLQIKTNPQGLADFLKSMPNVTVDRVQVRPLLSRSLLLQKPA